MFFIFSLKNIYGQDSFGRACSLNVNINCDDWVEYSDLKKSVFKFSINHPQGGQCTATLLRTSRSLNEDLNDPLFITASHCIRDNNNNLFSDYSLRAYFNFESL